eukprot:Nk52_evm8s2103 gene=Nk52_evmTU8s2103
MRSLYVVFACLVACAICGGVLGGNNKIAFDKFLDQDHKLKNEYQDEAGALINKVNERMQEKQKDHKLKLSQKSFVQLADQPPTEEEEMDYEGFTMYGVHKIASSEEPSGAGEMLIHMAFADKNCEDLIGMEIIRNLSMCRPLSLDEKNPLSYLPFVCDGSSLDEADGDDRLCGHFYKSDDCGESTDGEVKPDWTVRLAEFTKDPNGPLKLGKCLREREQYREDEVESFWNASTKPFGRSKYSAKHKIAF